MSIRVMSTVWTYSKAKGGDLLVLLAIADFAHDNGVAFPSNATLAKKARMTERHVIRVTSQLVKAGELEIRKNKGMKGTNLFRVLVREDDSLSYVSDTGVREEMTPASSRTVREPSVKSSGDDSPRVAKAERDAIWDAIQEAVGYIPEGIGERSLFGKCVKELLAIGGTPDEVKTRARRWPMKYPNATLTPRALVMHWGELGGRKVSSAANVDCPKCSDKLENQRKLTEHLYDKHDTGKLCPDCATVIGENEEHKCSLSK